MTSRPRSPRRKRLLGLALVPLLFAGALTAAPAHARTGAASASDPLPELTRAARPLASTAPGGPAGDLRPLVAAVGDAEVAGVGEATHNSRQFFTFRDRLFRHLVEKKGYRTFVLEANWSAGVRIDAYIRGGKGDIRRIMREEFQNSYRLWNTREYLDLFEWMRAYNQPIDPGQFPTTAGAVLRERLGGRYVSLRTTFDRGSFNVIGPDGEMGTFTVGPAPSGSNEHLLDQVPYRDFALDLRTVGEPAREWLAEARLSRQVGTNYPPAAETPQSLARSADVLVHLHEVDAAERLPG